MIFSYPDKYLEQGHYGVSMKIKTLTLLNKKVKYSHLPCIFFNEDIAEKNHFIRSVLMLI